MQIRIPIPNVSFLRIRLDFVSAHVPMLLGMDVLDLEILEILVANNATKELLVPLSGWSMPVGSKFEHLYLCCGAEEVLYTKPELVKLKKHVGHPSIRKLY